MRFWICMASMQMGIQGNVLDEKKKLHSFNTYNTVTNMKLQSLCKKSQCDICVLTCKHEWLRPNRSQIALPRVIETQGEKLLSSRVISFIAHVNYLKNTIGLHNVTSIIVQHMCHGGLFSKGVVLKMVAGHERYVTTCECLTWVLIAWTNPYHDLSLT